MQPGPLNLITDVAGLSVGQASNSVLKSGVTVVLGDAPFVAAVHVMGGAPGTRETDLLAPGTLVDRADALVLSGGSAFGLSAADGVMGGLRRMGRGFAVADRRVPIVPTAILYDLASGGDHDWMDTPYPTLGARALEAAAQTFALGSHGAGTGALAGRLKGGIGSASAVLENGTIVGALVAVNALGGTACPHTGRFWAALFEQGREFGARGAPEAALVDMRQMVAGTATTIAVVATDATLDVGQAQRMAIMAHDGMARAILPSHTPFDGDLVFAAATGTGGAVDAARVAMIGHAAAVCLSRAIARGVYAATPGFGDPWPTWEQQWDAVG